jgi:hypothetical protein
LVLETNVLPTELRTQKTETIITSVRSLDEDLLVSIEALFDASGFAHPIAEIEKFSSSDSTTADDGNGVYLRRMKQEDPLYTYTLENATDGNGFIDTTMPSGNDDPFVGLNPFLVAFFDLYTDFNGVTNVNLGQVTFKVLCLNRSNNFLGVHGEYRNSCQNSRILILTINEHYCLLFSNIPSIDHFAARPTNLDIDILVNDI